MSIGGVTRANSTHTLIAALADLYGDDFARHVGRNVNASRRVCGTNTSQLPVDPEQITIARKYVVKMLIGLEPCDNNNYAGCMALSLRKTIVVLVIVYA